MPICPICQGESVIPFDRGAKAHCTRPCPISCGCNGVGKVSQHKLCWIIDNMVDGVIRCKECGKTHKVHLKDGNE